MNHVGDKSLVLVIDDEEFILDVVEQMLRELGYDVILAASPGEAYAHFKKAKLENFSISVTILDLYISDNVRGEEIVENLLKINPQARIIVSSGAINDPVMQNYTKYGFIDRLKKPYTMDELHETIIKSISHT